MRVCACACRWAFSAGTIGVVEEERWGGRRGRESAAGVIHYRTRVPDLGHASRCRALIGLAYCICPIVAIAPVARPALHAHTRPSSSPATPFAFCHVSPLSRPRGTDDRLQSATSQPGHAEFYSHPWYLRAPLTARRKPHAVQPQLSAPTAGTILSC